MPVACHFFDFDQLVQDLRHTREYHVSYYKMFSAGKDAASVLVLAKHVYFESTRQSTEKGEGPAM